MNDIIKMAQEAGVDDWWDSGNEQREVLQEVLERFAALVRADEREQCAKVCESLFDADDDTCDEAEKCAAAIRSRT